MRVAGHMIPKANIRGAVVRKPVPAQDGPAVSDVMHLPAAKAEGGVEVSRPGAVIKVKAVLNAISHAANRIVGVVVKLG